MNTCCVIDNLDALIKKLGITDLKTELPPITEEECSVVKIQLIAAKIILNDLEKIKKEYPHVSQEQITNKLIKNWTENIKQFVDTLQKESL